MGLLRETAPSPALNALAREIQQAAEQFPNRGPLSALGAKTLVAAGSIADAESYLSVKAVELQTPELLMQLGEVQELLKKWPAAATSYDRAWDLDRTQPAPLLLEGLALRQAGDPAGGQRLIDLAHQLPLGNDGLRLQMLLLCEIRHADADAAIERDLLMKVGDPHGPGASKCWGPRAPPRPVKMTMPRWVCWSRR